MTHFHRGPWEHELGFSQAVTVGNRILVSGCVGDAAKNEGLASQMMEAYNTIAVTLEHFGATYRNIIKETVYCRDIEALKAAQELRKTFYNDHGPAATWVQVERLYLPEYLIEIEVEAVLE